MRTHAAVKARPTDRQPKASKSAPQLPGFACTAKPLDSELLVHFEQRFGHDFSRVRIHADVGIEHQEHQDTAALTRGWDIAFAPGFWSPDTTRGRQLLAHELTHVVQQTSGEGARPIDYDAAEREAENSASMETPGRPMLTFGSRPFGVAAAAPATPTPAAQPKVVPAADVERLVQDIRRVVLAAQLPGIDMVEVANVLTALREYGSLGKVVWGNPGNAYGQYDYETDTIILSQDRFNIQNPGHIAAIAIFHEASHTMRWRTAGPLADATKVVEEGLNPTLETTYWAAINRELKLYREEVLAYSADKGVTASYYFDVGIDTREEAARRLATTDPTQGTSATASFNRLRDLILEYEAQAHRDVELQRFLQDAHVWAATGENMPDFRKYLMP